MQYQKPNTLFYKSVQGASWLIAKLIFRRKFLRNEIKGKKGPFVVIANHQAALDFVNLIGATSRPMSFVISKSFFTTLPAQGLLKHMGMIPKQQFQTSVKDLKKMKAVIDHGQPLVIYPAGLMCEDGLSTPIPAATYKFLKWIDADVYVARAQGSYFVMPKWSKGFRPGRTYMDIYQLISKEELKTMPLETVRKMADEALLYDAYREQEALQVSYSKGNVVRGLENVLYICPDCGKEFTITAVADDTLRCNHCGFTATSDKMGFLTTNTQPLRYISDWSRKIYNAQKEKFLSGEDAQLQTAVEIRMVHPKKHKFTPVGCGQLLLDQEGFHLSGTIDGEERTIDLPICGPTLPFSPGRHLELQDGGTIYRCLPEQGHLVMKFVNTAKILYELKNPEKAPA